MNWGQFKHVTFVSDVKVGSSWQHYNGYHYVVEAITNVNTQCPDQYPVTVVYRNIANGTLWSRPLAEWYRSMTRLSD